MEEKQAAIRRELERVFQEWSARTAFIGAAIFMLLSALDFYAVPALAARFLAYRVAVAVLLTACGAFCAARARPRWRGERSSSACWPPRRRWRR